MAETIEAKDYYQFKDKNTLEARKNESKKQKQSHPNMIPVIVEWHKKSKTLKPLKKKKFLVSQDLTLKEFQQTIKKKLNMNDKDALFFFINKNELKNQAKTMKEIYNESKDSEDDFLYVTYSDTETFGCNL